MIFVSDIGNTSISIGAYKDDKLIFTTRLFTDRRKSEDEYLISLKDILSLHKIDANNFSGAVISSVVPEVTTPFSNAIKKLIKKEPIQVGSEHHGNFKVEILPVSYIGADLIAASVGALKKYPLPCLIADLGTATKILVIDENGIFRGCTIAPGVKISLDALSEKTSLLPDISLEKPERVIGENTVQCMQSGIVFGTASMLDGMIKRIKNELNAEDVTVVTTGGYSKEISECCESEIIYDENLLLEGLLEIYRSSLR